MLHFGWSIQCGDFYLKQLTDSIIVKVGMSIAAFLFLFILLFTDK